MFKITVLYETGVEGEYTKVVQVAKNESELEYKEVQMIGEWLPKLCPHIDYDKYHNCLFLHQRQFIKQTSPYEKNLMLSLINKTLEDCNMFDYEIAGIQMERRFTISVEKYEN